MEFAPFLKAGLLVVLILTIGLLGRTRRIGFWGAFILAIILTPVGGFLAALISGPRPIGAAKRSKSAPAPIPPKKNSWFSRAS